MKTEHQLISRKEFIAKVGAAAGFAILYACTGSCTKMDDPKIHGSAGQGTLEDCYTIDLSDPGVATDFQTNKYIIIDNLVVVALTSSGEYIATSRKCSHESFDQIIWEPTFEEWYCTKHDATFNATDGFENGHYTNVGSSPLPVYTTSVSGNTLTVCTV